MINDAWTVSVIIPNYNGESLLKKNLPAIISAKENSRNKIREIIVIDDASTDQSVQVIKKEFKEIRVIRHKVNRRFSAAVNTGARSAKSNYLCLINSDVSPSKDFLEKVLPHFQDEHVFGVSLNEVGYTWAKGMFRDGFVEHKGGKRSSKVHQTFWVNGGSGVYRRDFWMKLKGMDEILYPPFYWEDIDLSYRAMKRGFRLVWEPAALVKHEHESTNKKFNANYRSRIQERNQLLFIWKNITSLPLTKKHIKGLIKRTLKHPGYMRIVLMALLKLSYIQKLRKIEHKEATVSDESIFAQFT